jgi:hypothetical protein
MGLARRAIFFPSLPELAAIISPDSETQDAIIISAHS